MLFADYFHASAARPQVCVLEALRKLRAKKKNLRRVVDPYEQKYERGRRSGLRQREAIYGPLNKQGDTSGQGQILIKVVPVYQLFLFGTFLSHLKLFRMTIQQDPYEPVKPLGTLGLGLS